LLGLSGAESVKEYEYMLEKKKKKQSLPKESDPSLMFEEVPDKQKLLFGGKYRVMAFNILDDPSTVAGQTWATFMGGVIILSSLSIVISSIPSLRDEKTTWYQIETLCVSIFTFGLYSWI
jgi:hypothetical protein